MRAFDELGFAILCARMSGDFNAEKLMEVLIENTNDL